MILVVAALLGALLCCLPLALLGAEAPPPPLLFVALPLLAAALAVIQRGEHWGEALLAGALAGTGPGVAVLLRALLDAVLWPGSHNLLPLELAGATLAGMGLGAVGGGAGFLALRAIGRVLPEPQNVGVVVAGLVFGAVAGYLLSVMLDKSRDAQRAQDEAVGIAMAQADFRAHFPDEGYSCDLGQLGVDHAEAVPRPAESWRAGTAYLNTSNAHLGSYRLRLYCLRDEDWPRTRWLLTLVDTGWRGMPAFCADESGLVRRVRWRDIQRCGSEGEVVARLP